MTILVGSDNTCRTIVPSSLCLIEVNYQLKYLPISDSKNSNILTDILIFTLKVIFFAEK